MPRDGSEMEGRKIVKTEAEVIRDEVRGNVQAMRVVRGERRKKPYPMEETTSMVHEEISPGVGECASRE